MKIDLHVHSNYSSDSLITPQQLVYSARKCGLDGVAITDHDRLDGAQKIAEETDLLIIPGMEITSLDGHIVGLNLQKPVSPGCTAERTVEKIHEAGGTAIACHPAGLFKGSLGDKTNVSFNAVEVINASSIPFSYSVKRANSLAQRLRLPQVAGTDAHLAAEIGLAYTLVEAEPTVDSVIEAVRKGLCEPRGSAIPWSLRLRKTLTMLEMRFSKSEKKSV